ncbi:hypothetical protein LINPERHAP2_LOCUS28626 [Linum perenne]
MNRRNQMRRNLSPATSVEELGIYVQSVPTKDMDTPWQLLGVTQNRTARMIAKAGWLSWLISTMLVTQILRYTLLSLTMRILT